MQKNINYVLVGCALSVLAGCNPATPGAGLPALREPFALRCEKSLPPTAITVEIEPEHVIYDNSRGVQELSASPAGSPASYAWTFKLGVTATELSSEVSVNSSYLTSPEGETCMRPAIKVKLAASPQRVYVAKEFPHGSCAYKHIVEHEMRHVHENQKQVEAVALWLKGELTTHFGSKVYTGDQAHLGAQMSEAIREQWIPMAQQALARVEVAHQAIDTPEEYARNHAVCDGVIPATLAALFGR